MSNAATAAGDLGALPAWDLGDLYPGPDSPELETDLAGIEDDVRTFHRRHAGKVAALGGAALGEAVAAFEAIEQTIGRILSYAQLVHAGDMADAETGRFYQTTVERVNRISSELVFFTLELNRIDDDALAEKMKAPEGRGVSEVT